MSGCRFSSPSATSHIVDGWTEGGPHCYYNDVIMSAMASQITSLTIVYSSVYIQAQIKENIKAPRHWPLCGEVTGDRWIPRTKGQLRGNCFYLMTSSWCWDMTAQGLGYLFGNFSVTDILYFAKLFVKLFTWKRRHQIGKFCCMFSLINKQLTYFDSCSSATNKRSICFRGCHLYA